MNHTQGYLFFSTFILFGLLLGCQKDPYSDTQLVIIGTEDKEATHYFIKISSAEAGSSPSLQDISINYYVADLQKKANVEKEIKLPALDTAFAGEPILVTYNLVREVSNVEKGRVLRTFYEIGPTTAPNNLQSEYIKITNNSACKISYSFSILQNFLLYSYKADLEAGKTVQLDDILRDRPNFSWVKLPRLRIDPAK